MVDSSSAIERDERKQSPHTIANRLTRFLHFPAAAGSSLQRSAGQFAHHFRSGSRAFARYRVTDGVAEANAKEIDEDMKRDQVSMLE